jgi:hypothetical protein
MCSICVLAWWSTFWGKINKNWRGQTDRLSFDCLQGLADSPPLGPKAQTGQAISASEQRFVQVLPGSSNLGEKMVVKFNMRRSSASTFFSAMAFFMAFQLASAFLYSGAQSTAFSSKPLQVHRQTKRKFTMSASLDGSLVLVAGGAGRVGKLVVEELLREHPGCRVRASVRDVEKAKDVLCDAITTSNGRLEVINKKKLISRKENNVFSTSSRVHARAVY